MIVLYIILGLIVLLFIVLAIIYFQVFYYNNKNKDNLYGGLDNPIFEKYKDKILENINLVKDIPYEVIRIPSKDDKVLVAKYYHVNDKAPVDILCHGYHGNSLRDFCGGLQISLKMGHNVILIDQRAHGESKGHTITFGIKEREDLISWIYYCRIRFGDDVKIFLTGISLGAATVIMTLSKKIPHNVVGVIADCPYSSPLDIILKVAKDRKLPKSILKPFVKLSALIFGGFKIDETNAIDSAKKSNVPILIIHSIDDNFVPSEMSKSIKGDNENVQLELFDGGLHGMSYFADTERYQELVNQFVNRVLGDNNK